MLPFAACQSCRTSRRALLTDFRTEQETGSWESVTRLVRWHHQGSICLFRSAGNTRSLALTLSERPTNCRSDAISVMAFKVEEYRRISHRLRGGFAHVLCGVRCNQGREGHRSGNDSSTSDKVEGFSRKRQPAEPVLAFDWRKPDRVSSQYIRYQLASSTPASSIARLSSRNPAPTPPSFGIRGSPRRRPCPISPMMSAQRHDLRRDRKILATTRSAWAPVKLTQ